MILSLNNKQRKIFAPLLSKALWSRINSCYGILFSNLKQNKKEHNIIISRVIISHPGLTYIETASVV